MSFLKRQRAARKVEVMATARRHAWRLIVGGCAASMLSTAMAMAGTQGATSGFAPGVDSAGKISVPADYRQWAFLGSWYVVEKGSGGAPGPAGFHTVYTQPESLEHYRRTGAFPDGAVLVKELLGAEAGELTTGDAHWGTRITGWFVMVKDTKGRFPNSSLWGNGWGWALFNAADATNTVTTHWRTECLGCHIPARDTDWVYTQGYPVLQRPRGQPAPHPR